MSPLDDLIAGDARDDGIDLFNQLATAVGWLRRGAMPGLKMWDAIEQALRWQLSIEPDWNEPDPLRSVLFVTLMSTGDRSAESVIAFALRGWLDATAATFNEGTPWRS